MLNARAKKKTLLLSSNIITVARKEPNQVKRVNEAVKKTDTAGSGMPDAVMGCI